MSSEDRIVGKVARVNSDRELIVNRGSEHGVTDDTHFYVRGDPVEVTDPDTGDVLGVVNKIKVVVRVFEVSERFSIARTFRTRRVRVRSVEDELNESALSTRDIFRNPLAEALQPRKPSTYEVRVETLRKDPNKERPISATDSVVEVGDVVESVLVGEDIDPVTTTLFR